MKNKKLKNQIFFARQFLLKKNRKGFLLAEETLKIILAVISIGFLVYFLSALYFANQDSEELEQAEASLEHLIEGINSEIEEVEIYNPDGWWIASWPYEKIIPNSCSNLGWKNCICIYPKGLSSIDAKGSAENSDEKGVCKEILKRTIIISIEKKQSPIKIENPPLKLNIKYDDEIIIQKNEL